MSSPPACPCAPSSSESSIWAPLTTTLSPGKIPPETKKSTLDLRAGLDLLSNEAAGRRLLIDPSLPLPPHDSLLRYEHAVHQPSDRQVSNQVQPWSEPKAVRGNIEKAHALNARIDPRESRNQLCLCMSRLRKISSEMISAAAVPDPGRHRDLHQKIASAQKHDPRARNPPTTHFAITSPQSCRSAAVCSIRSCSQPGPLPDRSAMHPAHTRGPSERHSDCPDREPSGG